MTRLIAIAALVVAVLAVGITVWRAFDTADTGCQATAWGTEPAGSDLPAGWTMGTSQYDVQRKAMTFLGPSPSDGTSSQPVIYATITCYPTGAADSVTRSADAATAAGQTVTPRTDLGDQAFSAIDDSGATFLQFRQGDVVVYLAAAGAATAGEVDSVASAFDLAMGGDGGTRPVGTSDGASPSPSDDTGAVPTEAGPSESAAAPDLEAALPTTVGDLQLSVDSATGDTILGDDPGSRALDAALRADGRSPTDLRVAQASDAQGGSDLVMTAFAVTGMDTATVRTLVLDAWLSASGAGVKTDTTTVGGQEVTRVDYGDEGALDYVLEHGGFIIDVSTADPELAAEAIKALP